MSLKSLLLVSLFSVALSPLFIANHASAATDPAAAINVTPGCSDPVAGLTYWNVSNYNTSSVDINWTNNFNQATGVYSVPAGTSVMPTSYSAADHNNTTNFTYGATAQFQTNAPESICAPTTVTPPPVVVTPPPASPTCIDGKDQQNLSVTWLTDDTVNISSKGGLPLCEDVEIYVSSYTMPDTYNGAGFQNNPTAYPQSLFSSVKVTLLKGTFVNQNVTISLPPSCKNIQTDVYYGPELTTVGPQGHGTSNIYSKIYASTGTCTPGTGSGGTVTPPTTTPPATTPPAQQTSGGKGSGQLTNPADLTLGHIVYAQQDGQLANTGSNLLASFLFFPIALALIGYTAAFEYQTRKQSRLEKIVS